ncbi:unnamed protein product [Polarella glacialis]|uniref:Uncharacterized protein n=1 Tax=Polarella glacialis TaxID=89957 RepID=A0A813LV95_POLGL|nr:unnamed protein product [Polarella glacialis]
MMSLSFQFRRILAVVPRARPFCSRICPPAPDLKSKILKLGGTGLACAGLQYYFGSEDDFYDHRFVSSKKPEDLADFYGSEDFMEIFCVLPFMMKFMIRSGTFDEEGVVHTFGFPGKMEVSMAFEDKEADINGDGTMTTTWFNKHERFHDLTPFGRITLWDMTQNFGFHRLENGTCEVYHHGESFYGPFPIRILFQVHAKYVAWATERFVNCGAFGDEDKVDEAAVQRADMPLHVFKEFLEGLHHDVQQALEHQRAKSKPTAHIEATLKQLKQEIVKVGPDSCQIAVHKN